MDDYNRMHAVGVQTTPSELGDIEAALKDMDNMDLPPSNESPPPPSTGAQGAPPPPAPTEGATPAPATDSASTDTPNTENKKLLEEFTPSQTFGLVAILWVLLAVSIIIAILFNVIGGKKESTLSGDTDKRSSISTGMETVPLAQIQAEENTWKDTMTITKEVIISESGVIPVFTGTPKEYGKQISFAVDQAKYNMIADGATVQITFKRLGINGDEKVIVLKWTEMK